VLRQKYKGLDDEVGRSFGWVTSFEGVVRYVNVGFVKIKTAEITTLQSECATAVSQTYSTSRDFLSPAK